MAAGAPLSKRFLRFPLVWGEMAPPFSSEETRRSSAGSAGGRASEKGSDGALGEKEGKGEEEDEGEEEGTSEVVTVAAAGEAEVIEAVGRSCVREGRRLFASRAMQSVVVKACCWNREKRRPPSRWKLSSIGRLRPRRRHRAAHCAPVPTDSRVARETRVPASNERGVERR